MSNEDNIRLENIEGYIWHNGKFIKSQDAKIHMLTHSLHYAGGVFEGIKSFNGKIFKLEEHITRLFNSCAQVELKIEFSKEEIMQSTEQLLKMNNLSNSYIRPFVWRSTENLAVLAQGTKYNILVAAWSPRKKKKLEPLKMNISRWIKPTPEMNPIQCKSSSYYAMLSLVGNEAIKIGYDDSIMLDINRNVAECTTSNIFFIKNGELFTPTTKNCLNGITRQTVLEIAAENNIAAFEQDITLGDLSRFDSAFVTGTAAGLKEIGSIYLPLNDNLVYEHKDLPITHQISYKSTELFKFLKTSYVKLTTGIDT